MQNHENDQAQEGQQNMLIDHLNGYLKVNGMPFEVASITLSPLAAGTTERGLSHKDASKSFSDDRIRERIGQNEDVILAICDPNQRPNCENGKAVCIINHGSNPYWECWPIND